MKSNMTLLLLFLGLFHFIGFAVLFSGLWDAHRSNQAGRWPTTPGTIAHLEMTTERDSEGDPLYAVAVRYKYSVDGLDYEGTRIAFGYSHSKEKQSHEDLFRKLKGGKTVKVRYDGDKPKVSCLSYGIHEGIWFQFIFAAIWLSLIFSFTFISLFGSTGSQVLIQNLSVQ